MAIDMKELYWAAGFLEGEGSFTAVNAGRRKDGRCRSSFNPMVHAGQVNLDPLMKIQDLFGGHIYQHNMHTGNPCWRWQLSGRKGIALMMTMWSLMSRKRKEQIETAIAKWKSNQLPNGLNHLHAIRRGEKHPFAKLTDIQIGEIRKSVESLTTLAKKYNVSFSTIGKIKRNERRMEYVS